MKLDEFQAALEASPEIVELSTIIARELARRGEDIGTWLDRETHAGDAIEDLNSQRAELCALVEDLTETVDFSDRSSVASKAQYASLNLALKFAKLTTDVELDRNIFVHAVVRDLIVKKMAGIDQYVKSIRDTALLDELGLPYGDDYFLVDISSGDYELLDQGLVVRGSRLVYPHQFMRDAYAGSFTRLLMLLRSCIQRGLSVKLRIDPLRMWTDVRNYRGFIGKERWYGEPFNIELLKDSDKTEQWTVHRPVGQYHGLHPVDTTIFRTSMMAPRQRQFMIEEFTPLTNPTVSDAGIPGFGSQYCVQRFGHFIYDQEVEAIVHLDGAVRTFTIDEYIEVFVDIEEQRVPDSKIGERHKLFLVEGRMDMAEAYSLLYEFFAYNYHIEEYFSSTQPDA